MCRPYRNNNTRLKNKNNRRTNGRRYYFNNIGSIKANKNVSRQ